MYIQFVDTYVHSAYSSSVHLVYVYTLLLCEYTLVCTIYILIYALYSYRVCPYRHYIVLLYVWVLHTVLCKCKTSFLPQRVITDHLVINVFAETQGSEDQE